MILEFDMKRPFSIAELGESISSINLAEGELTYLVLLFCALLLCRVVKGVGA